MTLDEFVVKYTGVPVDFDGAYGNQCFDLYRKYVQDVLGFPQSPSTGTAGAKTIWDNYLKDYFEAISNTPTGYPQKGDIVIWGSVYGIYGHVAICTEATVNTFKCFSQNDPAGSLPAIKWYKNYTGVLGWLRAKQQTDTEQLKKDLAEQQQQVRNYVEQVAGKDADIKKKDSLITEITGQLKEANDKSKGFKDERDSILFQCANELGTRQEIVDIVAAIKSLVKRSDDYTDYEKQVELDKKEEAYQDSLREKKHKDDVDSLGKQLKTAKDLLEALQIKYDALVKPEDTQITPSNVPQKSTIIDIIKKLLGV